jgi:hypothetical protein
MFTSVLVILAVANLILAIVCFASEKIPVKVVVLFEAIILAVLCAVPLK